MWISVILIVGMMVIIGFCAYEEYQKAKYSNEEDAMQKFWNGVGIGVIVFLLICGFFGYKYVNMKSDLDHYRYHDYKTGQGQIQYQGSQEQQQDLKAIDDYSRKNKDF